MKTLSAVLFSCIFFSTLSAFATLRSNVDLRVVFIRHGEKPDDDSNHNLSCKGYNRSVALPQALMGQIGTPNAIYVPKMKLGDVSSSTRMYQTAIPLAVRTGLQINTAFKVEDHQAIARDISSKSGTILVVWEHKNIAPIVQQLGIDNRNLKWHGDDFDSMWIVDFVQDGQGKSNPEFKTSQENITPGPNCPF